MIAWAMGAATGHTAVALWRHGELFICESNAKVNSTVNRGRPVQSSSMMSLDKFKLVHFSDKLHILYKGESKTR
jgi:hypothetical protein